MTARRRAPWPDFAANPIYEGDTIRHPDGRTGAVIYVDAPPIDPAIRWRVRYPDLSYTLWLDNQIGDKGMAVVVNPRENHVERIERFYSMPTTLLDQYRELGIPFDIAACGICGAEIWSRKAPDAGGHLPQSLANHLFGHLSGCCANRKYPKFKTVILANKGGEAATWIAANRRNHFECLIATNPRRDLAGVQLSTEEIVRVGTYAQRPDLDDCEAFVYSRFRWPSDSPDRDLAAAQAARFAANSPSFALRRSWEAQERAKPLRYLGETIDRIIVDEEVSNPPLADLAATQVASPSCAGSGRPIPPSLTRRELPISCAECGFTAHVDDGFFPQHPRWVKAPTVPLCKGGGRPSAGSNRLCEDCGAMVPVGPDGLVEQHYPKRTPLEQSFADLNEWAKGVQWNMPAWEEAQRRAAFRDRCSKLLDGFADSPQSLRAAPWWMVEAFHDLRASLAAELDAELDAFLAATPMPRDPSAVPEPVFYARAANERLRNQIVNLESNLKIQADSTTGWKKRAAFVEEERDEWADSARALSELLDKRTEERDSAKATLAEVSAQRDRFERECLAVMADRDAARKALTEGVIQNRNAQNRRLRELGLPEGLAGFDALVASYQQLAAIDKALATSEPDEDETQDQLDRIEARVNDIGIRVGYHFSAPPTEDAALSNETIQAEGLSPIVERYLGDRNLAYLVISAYGAGMDKVCAKAREPFGWVILNRNDAPLGVNGTWCLYPSDGRLVGAALEALNGPDRPPSSAAHQPYRKVLVMLAEPSGA